MNLSNLGAIIRFPFEILGIVLRFILDYFIHFAFFGAILLSIWYFRVEIFEIMSPKKPVPNQLTTEEKLS